MLSYIFKLNYLIIDLHKINTIININEEDKIKASHKYYCLQKIGDKYKNIIITIDYIDSDKSFIQFIRLLQEVNNKK